MLTETLQNYGQILNWLNQRSKEVTKELLHGDALGRIPFRAFSLLLTPSLIEYQRRARAILESFRRPHRVPLFCPLYTSLSGIPARHRQRVVRQKSTTLACWQLAVYGRFYLEPMTRATAGLARVDFRTVSAAPA